MGAFSGLHDLHREIHVPDPAADQGGIEDHCFHEAIPGASEHLVFFGLRDPSGRVSTAVDGNSGFIAVNKKTGNTGKQLYDHFTAVR